MSSIQLIITAVAIGTWVVPCTLSYGIPDLVPVQLAHGEEFFVGTFVSNPKTAVQVNMWEVYTAFGFPPDYINRNMTLKISPTSNNSYPNQTYLYSMKVHQPAAANNDQVEFRVELSFQLGVKDRAEVQGRLVEYKFDAIGSDLILKAEYSGVGSFQEKYKFKLLPEFNGAVAHYSVPKDIRGRRTFTRVREKVKV